MLPMRYGSTEPPPRYRPPENFLHYQVEQESRREAPVNRGGWWDRFV